MTPEQLMKRRWKVIASYPNTPFPPDYIIKEEENLLGATFYNVEIPKYLHLFRELAWYEERQESDMPKYVKYYDTDTVEKVISWYGGGSAIMFPEEMTGHSMFWIPATEQEYIDYQNKKP